ncbi:MAG: type IV secretion system DNA-binding domain-containing protein [Halobacteriovoraceae bacterium]|nr:type IV secretion system DNA-binding domain-containing protein [Halobacteriovoraceae bacterium]
MSNSNAKAFKAFETFWTDLRMKIKMISYLAVVIGVLQIMANLIHFIGMDDHIENAKSIYLKCHIAKIIDTIPYLNEEKHFEIGDYSLTAGQFSHAYRKLYGHYNLEVLKFFVKSFLIWLILPFILFVFKRKSAKQMADVHLGGTEVISEKKFSKKIKKSKQNISLNKLISIPFECENRHFFVIGKQGAGKSQVFSRAIDKIIERKEKSIIYDFKGDYIAKFYNPETDLIFNPLDERSLGWCLFNEIKTKVDIENISYSYIPPSNAKDPFWDDGARDIFYSVLYYCWKNDRKTNKDVFEISKLPPLKMVKLFSSTEGCERGIPPLLEPKVAASIRSVFFQKVKSLEYAQEEHGNFSIKKWIEDETFRGRIFIVGQSETKDIIAPLFTLFLDIAAKKFFMLPENLQRRLFFFIDEFGTLKRMNNIPDLLKLSRSYGGSVWLGIQDTGQIKDIYGYETTKTIIGNCANSIILGVEEPDDAEYLSKKISDKKIQTMKENLSFGVEDYKDGHSLGVNDKTERAVLASEILRLSDLSFYLKLSTIAEYTLTKVNFRKFEERQTSFIQRNVFVTSEEDRNDESDSDEYPDMSKEIEKVIAQKDEAEFERDFR